MTSLRDIKCPHCVTLQLTVDAQCERRTDTAYKINSFVHSTFIIYINMSVYLSLVHQQCSFQATELPCKEKESDLCEA